MKKTLLYFLIFIASAVSAQVSINDDGSQPDASSMLDIKSTTGGILIPRMTTAERDAIASPAPGLEIFNLTNGCKQIYYSGQWNNTWCYQCNVVISSQPYGRTVCETGSTTFGTIASGQGISYQWQESSDEGVTWNDLSNNVTYSGVTTATLSLTGIAAGMDSLMYRCNIGGDCSPALTDAVPLYVKVLSIDSQPSAVSTEPGGNASFSVSASGCTISYQWQESTDGGTTWSNVSDGGIYSGAGTNSLSLTSVTASMKYRCVVSDDCGTNINSDAVPLRVYPSGTVFCIAGGTEVVDVTNPTTGDTWMDRNLGALQAATSSTDSDAYGSLYQWGRFSDGHQCRTSSTTTTIATTAVPEDGNVWDGLFIKTSSSPNNWLTPQDDNLWQGVSGTNNPCPSGYRLPTETELDNERLSWSSQNAAGAYASPLKFPAAGDRAQDGSFNSGFGACYSSTSTGTNGYYLNIGASSSTIAPIMRARGLSVRCIKD